MQTTFNETRDIAFEGMISQSTPHKIISSVKEGTLLEFGLGCTYGTDKVKQRTSLAAITEKFAGVLVHEHTEEGEILENRGISIMEQGDIYVTVEDAVDPTKGVFVRAVAAGAERAGAFRGTADGTDTIDLSAYCKWSSVAGAGELAVLTLNLP